MELSQAKYEYFKWKWKNKRLYVCQNTKIVDIYITEQIKKLYKNYKNWWAHQTH